MPANFTAKEAAITSTLLVKQSVDHITLLNAASAPQFAPTTSRAGAPLIFGAYDRRELKLHRHQRWSLSQCFVRVKNVGLRSAHICQGKSKMQRIIFSLAFHIVVVIASGLFVVAAAAQHQITYDKVILEGSYAADDRRSSQLVFKIEGFRIDGLCYHNCDISFSLHASQALRRAELKLTQDLVTSRIPTGSAERMFIGNRENTANERMAISMFREREKLALAWIIEHSTELISFANATGHLRSHRPDFWLSQDDVFPARVEKVFSTVLRGYRDRSETRNTNDHTRAVIQPALAKIGLYSGSIDGVAGRITRAAVSVFQKELGRLVTGYADSEERAMLEKILKGEGGGEALLLVNEEDGEVLTHTERLAKRLGIGLESEVDVEETPSGSAVQLTRLQSENAQLQTKIDALKRLSADQTEIIRTLRVELSQTRVELRQARSSSEFDPDTQAVTDLRRQLEAANATIVELRADSVTHPEAERLEESLADTANAPTVSLAPTGLPTFGATTTPMSASIADHCNAINVLTSTNGGFTTLGTMTNPAFVLDEQFCLARTVAIAEAARAMGSMTNVAPAQFSAQCDGLGAFMQPKLEALQDNDPTDMTNDVQMTLTGSGQSMEQLAIAGAVCLGLGYQADKAEVALGSALLMVGTGHSAYGEIVAHQLRGGFGAEQCEACSDAWMTATITSLEGGATPAFLPNQSADRIALLKAASLGRDAPTTTSEGTLPTFGASD